MIETSIIIPYYNRQETILRALNSVINQIYKDYEIILINDGSNDNSCLIVNEFMQNNTHINIKHIQQCNQGVSAARNSGIKEAEGEYIAFLDSDDEWLPEKLEKQMKLMKQNNIDMIGCNIRILNKNKENFKIVCFENLKKITFKHALFKYYYHTSATIIRKDVLIDINYFPKNQNLSEDNYVFTTITRKYNCYVTNDIFLNVYKNLYGAGGLSKSFIKAQVWDFINYFNYLKENKKYPNNKLKLSYYILANLFAIIKFTRRTCLIIINKIKGGKYEKT